MTTKPNITTVACVAVTAADDEALIQAAKLKASQVESELNELLANLNDRAQSK